MTVASGNRWLARLTAKAPRRNAGLEGRASGRSYRLSLDVLEDRTTPSTIAVTTDVDPIGKLVPGSLRWAVSQANLPQNQGSTIEITPSVHNAITLLAGELRINSSVTIENATGAPLSILQATPFARVLNVANSPRTGSVTITGLSPSTPLTLTGGNVRNGNGGGILVQNSQNNLNLTYVNVVNNSAMQVSNPQRGATANGGGIYSRGTVTLDHSSVSSNMVNGLNGASGHAGGVYTDQGITLISSHVDGNSSRNSAGLLNVFGSVQLLSGSTVNNNTSTGNSFNSGDLGGGGISQMSGNVIVSQSQVNNNHTAGMYSGGIVILLGGVTVTDGSQVNGNTNKGPGGGIAANFEGPVTISHGSQVNGNTGGGVGGGIVNFSESFGINVVDNSQVSNNIALNDEVSNVVGGLIQVAQDNHTRQAILSGGRGDAMLQSALQLFVNACAQRVSQLSQARNSLPAGGNTPVGGGLAEMLGGPVIISGNSSVNGNQFIQDPASTLSSQGIGGGIFTNLGPMTVDGSTISGNTAPGTGGGIWNGGSLTITNSTVNANRAGGNGGGIFNRGKFTSTNTTVDGNSPDNIFP